MKRIHVCLVILILGPGIASGQKRSSWMIANPEFEQYLELKNKGEWKTTTDRGYPLGYLPAPYRIRRNPTPAVLMDTKSGEEVLPGRFDLRDSSWVTSIKNQGGGDAGGNCTMFATMGSLESRWLSNGLDAYDLSEQNLATCHGYEWAYGEGANQFICSAYLTRFAGPVLESQDPYNTEVHTCTPIDPIALVPEARWLPARDFQLLKKAIYYYGAIWVSITWDTPSFNALDNTYFYSGSGATNHALLVVGWDDELTTGAPTDGAWIVKNSWGPGWADGGYFYVSYADTKFGEDIAYFPYRWDTGKVDSLYIYDHLGGAGTELIVPGTHYYYELAKFETPEEQLLTRIGFQSNYPDTYFDVEVYDDFSDGKLGSLLASRKGFIARYAGNYTLEIPTTVDGDFYVRLKRSVEAVSSPENDTVFIPVEAFVADYMSPVIEEGVNWTSPDGSLWFSTSEGTSPYNLTIRAYTSGTGAPKALFTANKTTGCKDSDFTFSYQENGSVDTWTWDFGKDAVPATASTEGPHDVTYSTEGTKSISLIVSGPGGSDTLVRNDYIYVTNEIDVTVLEHDVTINLGASAELTAYGADDYIWTPSATLSSGMGQTVTCTPVTEGEYQITVYGTQGNCSGSDQVNIISTNPPVNDNVCDAILIEPVGLVGNFSNVNGTTEPNEPVPPATGCVTDSTWCANEPGPVASIWFKFFGPSSGIAKFESGGDWDNQIAVYIADTCTEVTIDSLVAARDDETALIYPAKLTVDVIPGQKYFLQVDGSGNSQEGSFDLYFYASATGIEDGPDRNQYDGLTVYPNPARDVFNVRMHGVRSGQITMFVYNLNGQLIDERHYRDLSTEFYTKIDLGNSPAGIYQLRLIDGDRIIHRMIVRE